ncbi:putative protein N(5)-glutamine methyltransferase [Nocardioides sambongensis]|uniref:putative protein N(5)-glutamine methyltransferase n=1 Tax=Nocardioides sambongensis TaxID=2589074 RepID=UPI00112CF622|nr:putative protein N(5)-glutamine methyltransferase [Nocardioides sambongensis]
MPQPDTASLAATLRAAGCVFAEEEAALLVEAADGTDRLAELTRRRVAGEPLEYVVGWVAFDGHRIHLEPGVFIPRQRTTWLVEIAGEHLPPTGATVVDLGCGSGALGVALAHRFPGLVVHAVDIDPTAVAVARANLAASPAAARAHVGDLTAPLPHALRGTVDAIVANLPYVPSTARALMPAESRDHEPAATTDGGADGLDHVRRLAERAPAWLRPGGVVLVETGDAGTGQDARAAAAFASAGLRPEIRYDEERGATVVLGTSAGR